MSALWDAVHRVLITEWDPIGVGAYPEAQDECDIYIDALIGLVRSGADKTSIVRYLAQLETERMGLRERPDSCRERAAEMLLQRIVGPMS